MRMLVTGVGADGRVLKYVVILVSFPSEQFQRQRFARRIVAFRHAIAVRVHRDDPRAADGAL